MERYWGLQDSSITFCEKDYIQSPYIAEYYNTISGLAYSLVGLWFYNSTLSKETVYSLIVLGLSTSLFHGTMRYYGQMSDEVSMLILSFYLIKEVHEELPVQALGSLISIYFMANDMFPIFFLMFMSLQCYLYLLTDVIVKETSKWRGDSVAKLVRKKNYMALFGGTCWVIDMTFCDYIEITYLHALWHIFTAFALYYGCKVLVAYKIDKILKSE
jgi:dihydroceramidase